MKKDTNLDERRDFFSSKRIDDIILIQFKEDMRLRTTDLHARDAVLGYLDRV